MERKIRKSRVMFVILILVAVIIVSIVVFEKNESTKRNELSNVNISGNENKMNSNFANETSNVIINEINNENKVEDEVKKNEIKDFPDNSNKNEISSKPEDNGNNETNNSNKNTTFDETVAFIGDSRTQGFIMYNGLKYVQDYSYVGLMVDTAVTKKFIKNSNGKEITLLEDMKSKNIKKVYIMLGVNELGWSYPEVFKVKYKELIDEIRKVQPDCEIYLQSIIPVTKSRNETDKIYNNSNIQKFNKLIKEVAGEKNVKYLDVQSALVNSQGYLPDEASTDGIHISPSYCKKWLSYLKNNS